jgi:uncharacterized metal-binding protein YceD (DUF177 family)
LTTPEFSHRVPVEKLSTRAQALEIEADADQRAALATRFDLLSIDGLAGRLEMERRGRGAFVSGRLEASVVQRCVVSGEPVPATISEPLALHFEPLDELEGDIELEPQALDTLPVEDGLIDLGEAIAQSLLLALDPYPRASEEVLTRVRAHLLSEEEAEARAAAAKAEASPFARLKPR